MPVLFNFHLFIEAWNHMDAYDAETPAKISPLIFLTLFSSVALSFHRVDEDDFGAP